MNEDLKVALLNNIYELNNMDTQSDFLAVSKKQVISALISGLLIGVVAVASQILANGSIFGLDMHKLADVGAMAIITFLVSFLKSFLTTNDGKFIGLVAIK